MLEGEALLNDASSFTLFEIFLHLVEQLNEGSYHDESGWAVLWSIIKSALKLAGGDNLTFAKGSLKPQKFCHDLLICMHQRALLITTTVSMWEEQDEQAPLLDILLHCVVMDMKVGIADLKGSVLTLHVQVSI